MTALARFGRPHSFRRGHERRRSARCWPHLLDGRGVPFYTDSVFALTFAQRREQVPLRRTPAHT